MPVYRLIRDKNGRVRVDPAPVEERPTEDELARRHREERRQALTGHLRAMQALESPPETPATPTPAGAAPEAPAATEAAPAPERPAAAEAHPCPECSFKAATSAGLKSHLRARHGGE